MAGSGINFQSAPFLSPLNDMVDIEDYQGREQSYVKHVFLERYLERLVHKTASGYDHVVYVDGFAGPWQSANEQFQDTSFGIALTALRNAKATWKQAGRNVQMSAFLVERDAGAYKDLSGIPERYPEIDIKTYPGDFLKVLPKVLRDIPAKAFAFFFIDPKGWRIPLHALSKMLERRNSEVIFNFMFDFINRAASIKDPAVARGLDELIPYGDWRAKLEEADRRGMTSEARKEILVDAFGQSLAKIGGYDFVAETTILRPLSDRPLYCLCYATRHPKGIEVFRDCQIQALQEQARARAATKVKHAEATTGQREIFQSLHDMAPNELETFLRAERAQAMHTLLSLAPIAPDSITYDAAWPRVLTRHVVRRPEVNQLAAELRQSNQLAFPNWEKGKRVPQAHYKMQRIAE
jgi:three-Cys-motif partner protein